LSFGFIKEIKVLFGTRSQFDIKSVEKRIIKEQSHNTKEKKIENKNAQILRGKPSRERKPTAAAKTVFTNTQGSVTYIFILEIIYIYIYINKLINAKP
jgi:hypothetical protein